MPLSKPCAMCGKAIIRGRDWVAFERAKFCSKQCYWQSLKNNKIHYKPELHTGETVLCACGCGTKISERDNHNRIKKYVNGHIVRGRKRPDMIEKLALVRFKPCKETHWNWKGGITPINHSLRKSPEYLNWCKEVYKRDYWTCQICHKKQRQPIAHHLKSFKDYPDLRYEVSNGQTLCKSCHKKIHYGIGEETRFKPDKIRSAIIRANYPRKECLICGKTFIIDTGRRKGKYEPKYCSHECYAKSMEGKTGHRKGKGQCQPKICETCGKQFERDHHSIKQWEKARWCSKQCFYQSRKGIKRVISPEWREKLVERARINTENNRLRRLKLS